MKRALVLILLVMMVAWIASRREDRVRNQARTSRHDVVSRPVSEVRHETRRIAHEARQAVREAQQEIDEARREVREAIADAGEEIQLALQEVRGDVAETVAGLPVPIVPGTRVETAELEPPAPPESPEFPQAEAFPAPPVPPVPPTPPPHVARRKSLKPTRRQAQPAVKPEPASTQVITGLISATEERARTEARKVLDRQLADWLELEGVPRSWSPSTRQVDAMIAATEVEPVVKDYGTLYVAKLTVDSSPQTRNGLVRAYQRQVVDRRMVFLGGGLAFLLTCLGVLSGYIRADEATKGYYTNRLRLLAAAGTGAAGMAIYHMIG